MPRLSSLIRPVIPLACTLFSLLHDVSRFLGLCLRPSPALAAENLFLRKQLALYQEHHVTPRRVTHATRVALVWLSPWFNWPSALVVVQPETFQRWRRQGCHLFWRDTSCPGRPPIPVELQGLIRQMARDNLTWGQRRIANELRLKLGL
jgi:putative transposase